MPLANPTYTADDYWALPEGRRAELIDGELWDLAAPSRMHQRILSVLNQRMADYIDAHGGRCEVYQAPFAVNLFGDESTFVEPDLSVVCDRAKLSDRGCEGAPDLVVEVVSPGNPGMDYFTKLSLYQRAGVREYWICDPGKRRTLVYRFAEDSAPALYPFGVPVPAGIFPGLEVEIGAIAAGE